MDLRTLAAVAAAKLVTVFLRIRGSGGSTLPGRLARRIQPCILKKLAAQHTRGNVVISGTNGKTTTAKMMADIMQRVGWKPAHNRTGANLIYGITSEFIHKATLSGRMRTDIGLAEVDEATMPEAVADLMPSVAVITNFFRDQLDRYGELETTVSYVNKGLDAMLDASTLVLNADDPLVAALANKPRLRTLFFGVEDAQSAGEAHSVVGEIGRCARCGKQYEYSAVYYAHLGIYHCASCGYRRPKPTVALTKYTSLGPEGSLLEIDTPEGSFETELRVPGFYNAYNVLAAVGCALALGIEIHHVRDALSEFTSSFGRMESVPVAGRRVLIALVKNPTGFDEVIRVLLEGDDKKILLIAINDKYADGRDVSWLWDVNFERLAQQEQATRLVVTSGLRAHDMALRLRYAGLDTDVILSEPDLQQAFSAALEKTEQGGTLYVLPTYTAMLELRDILHSMGLARRFWEV